MRALMHYHRHKPFAPDRVRCFVQYLQGHIPAVRCWGLTANPYSASERLVKSNVALHVSFTDHSHRDRDLTMQVHSRASGNVLELDFGAFAAAADLLLSPPTLEMLEVGARMLSAEYAVFGASGDPDGVAPGGLSANVQPIAVWVGVQASLAREAGILDALTNLKPVREQWDGARLWVGSRNRALT